MKWLFKFLISRGMTKGIASGNKFFTLFGLIAMALKLARRSAGTDDKTLFSHKMRAGDRIVVDTTGHLKK